MKTRGIMVTALVVALAVALFGCSQPAPDYTRMTGAWQYVEEASNIDLSIFGVGDLEYLEIDGGAGVVTAYGRDPDVDLAGCSKKLATFGDNRTITFWVGSCSTKTFSYELRDDGELALRDAGGHQAILRYVDEVPAGSRCKPVEFASEGHAYGLGGANGNTNLLSDGSDLWVVDSGGTAYPIDPDTWVMSMGTTLNNANPAFNHAKTMQGASYWVTCNCGGNDTIKRISLGGTELDNVDTASLGSSIGINAGVYSPASGHLWLSGYDYAAELNRLLEIDSDANPNALVRNYVFNLSLRAMSEKDGHLWGLVRFGEYMLVRLNPQAGVVDDAYQLPVLEEGARYSGLTVLGGEMYVMAERNDGWVVIYKLNPL